jgi:hypothetical protein
VDGKSISARALSALQNHETSSLRWWWDRAERTPQRVRLMSGKMRGASRDSITLLVGKQLPTEKNRFESA